MTKTRAEQAEYMREWRAAKKRAAQLEPEDIEVRVPRPIKDVKLMEVSVVKNPPHPSWKVEILAPVAPTLTREAQSNYYSDPAMKGGWTELIQNMSPKLAQTILDRIAPPRKLR